MIEPHDSMMESQAAYADAIAAMAEDMEPDAHTFLAKELGEDWVSSKEHLIELLTNFAVERVAAYAQQEEVKRCIADGDAPF